MKQIKYGTRDCDFSIFCIMSKFLGVFLWGIDFENSKVN